MSKQITYSPAYTLVPTYECFNRCTYCNFRVAPDQDDWLTLEKAEKILQKLQHQSICEILILSGEVHPQSSRRKAWFQRIYDLCQLALSLGFLPHTNVGPLSFTEMETLKTVNVSMGLMVEQISPKLLQTVHNYAPSKRPELRLQQLEWAGKLKIPFTTGLLLGIGETLKDCWETLDVISQIHHRWHHIQEVILQPHSPGQKQTLITPAFNYHQLPEIIAKAKEILPESITLQIPPNLITEPQCLLDCLAAGARDLGGIGPKDEVNPDYPHHTHQGLINLLATNGWQLVPRLPIYPQYDSWLSSSLQFAVNSWRIRTGNLKSLNQTFRTCFKT
ncbi:7,8-didemethyl-8-hydroxy-5-deazariboflavin synthase subunit CofG [Crocosphaera sp. UHCC 0190]|uniref:7,8-didemethyl-8-hydroxy-5-deazariboflavin synthase subunit CofG n=1 Tax=Crocosphaera sp. UHCC 0190 TaxID=3110246 RepID=UPI002B21B396|nr:7,8-didemethyl-8-hydroxy-5-deazariboflavin synthase subunit CofG [Crocosphaera sp. UHCC 0190]MEA5509650.1 7,8-didemethyl-8-hydroxy-5-deazariboflavin synthase subunit CofG [Crocosphaera sp. UHCC 0190]